MISSIRNLSAVRRKCLWALGLLLFTVQYSLTAFAQNPEQVDVVRIDTDLVTLNVSVFNKTAAQGPVTLQQKDFSVLDDGTPQEIAFFESGEDPFDLVLL